MTVNEKFLTQRQRYQPVTLPQDFSDEEMARDWTLSEAEKMEVNRYRIDVLIKLIKLINIGGKGRGRKRGRRRFSRKNASVAFSYLQTAKAGRDHRQDQRLDYCRYSAGPSLPVAAQR